MTICLKTSSAGSASEGFSDIHAETARMSGITNRVLRPVPDAEARRPIRGRHNVKQQKSLGFLPRAFLLPVVGIGQMSMEKDGNEMAKRLLFRDIAAFLRLFPPSLAITAMAEGSPCLFDRVQFLRLSSHYYKNSKLGKYS